ncbi:single-stranded DNA-binding protein 2 [Petromyzon marinus]|uniref:Single-stranded DNA-binding protein 3 isoform X1 n=1 Tax=Petromyzon marinus TaxID=7757 RepID=A0AAJ7TQP3_PETMA|nr:single-stranded DNA-binding protein 3 isoform X1 [Petromyzon marinus]
MYAKGKSAVVPSDTQAREKLALYVYEYLLHVGAQKSAQTFLSEIRWEKNITLGEPPGFLHSWWCVFWDLYCAAPERRETCDHSSEAKAFHDYSAAAAAAAAAQSPVLGNLPPNDGMPSGPLPPGFFPGPPGSQMSPHGHPAPPHTPNNPIMGPHGQPFMSPRYPGGPRAHHRMPGQPPGAVAGPQTLLPNNMDPIRNPGHPVMGGPLQRIGGPRGMGPMGPQGYGPGMRPPHNSLGGPGMPGLPLVPGGRPWPNPNSIPYSVPSPGNYGGPPGSGPPGTPIMPSPGDSNSSDMYTMMNPVQPGNRPNFPIGPGPEGPMGSMPGMGPMEPHHMNGSIGSGEMDGIPKNSPNNLSNQPGTPREEGEIPAGFLNAFQNDGDQNESAAILKIKESMQEEAKRFEKEPGDHADFTFMQ